MSKDGECFVFFWKIKNFSFFRKGGFINSPSFSVHSMDKTKLKLSFFPVYTELKIPFICYLTRVFDEGPIQLKLDYELSFLSSDGSVLHSEKYHQKVYNGSYSENFVLESPFKVEYYAITEDTLTVRCKMWNGQKSISQPEKYFAKTTMVTECRTFIGIIKNLSNTKVNCESLICVESSSTETFFSSMNLCIAIDGTLAIEIKPLENKSINFYRCKIYIRDVFGNKLISGKAEFKDTQLQRIPLNLLKKHIMENKDIYLADDDLTVECNIILSQGKKTEKIYNSEYEYNSENGQEIVSNEKGNEIPCEKDHIENLTFLRDDWISFFREGSLCDTKLKTDTETFEAHSVVLSARSPVFKSMFTTDMREKTNKCVDIDDLDADTVRRMLSFMYSASLEGLQYDSAKSLYFAADKYNISSLRNKCSNFLKENLVFSNCCDILILADKHQDSKLKRDVQDYIAKNDEAVLITDAWNDLEKSHPQLTIEVFHCIYKKFREV